MVFHTEMDTEHRKNIVLITVSEPHRHVAGPYAAHEHDGPRAA